MLRHISALPAMGRVLLACSLCLLAFAFAMEAKMAWYGPAPVKSVSAAKAMPADTPGMSAQRLQATHPVPPELVVTFAALLHATAGATPMRPMAHPPVQVTFRPHFSALLFFRPPPAFC